MEGGFESNAMDLAIGVIIGGDQVYSSTIQPLIIQLLETHPMSNPLFHNDLLFLILLQHRQHRPMRFQSQQLRIIILAGMNHMQ